MELTPEQLEQVKSAGRDACITLGLPISDAAFELIDDLKDRLTDTIGDLDDDEAFSMLEDGRWTSEQGNWMSGSGPISCYTSEQVQQWNDLGAWQADCSEWYESSRTDRDATWFIGTDLSCIADTIADTMAWVVREMIEAQVSA